MKGIVFPVIALVLLLAVLSLQILSLPGGESKIHPQQLRQLAAVLEQQGLYEAAISTYHSYLEAADIPLDQRANILYRIGLLYQEALADYENALATFIRLRELYPQARIVSEAQKRMVQCLEALGRMSDAKRQMRAIADVDAKKDESLSGPVVAKIDDRAITMGEIDREIDKLPSQLRAQYQDPSKKLDFLRQYLLQELLFDMGKRKGYEKEKEIRRRLHDIERQMIIQKVYQQEITDQVVLEPSDYGLYYQAHKEEFKEPAKIGLSHIQVPDEESGAEVMRRLKEGEKFPDLARELSMDTQTKNNGGELGEMVVGSTYVPSLGNEPEIAQAVSALEVGAVTGPIESTKGWHVLTVTRKVPERQKSLDEVRSQIEFALRRLKEQEKGEQLLKKMLDAQRVRIFAERFGTPASTPAS